MHSRFLIIWLAALLTGVAGGSSVAQAGDGDPHHGSFTLTEALKDLPGSAGGTLQAIVDTSKGRLTCVLFDKQAPITVANFIGLSTGKRAWLDARTGKWVMRPLYEGLIFHRVVPGLLIQSGDPLGTGKGSPGYRIQDELSPELTFDKPGQLAMANADPATNTNGSQFFITVGVLGVLNGRYTIFGHCDPQSVVKAIASVPKGKWDRPIDNVLINKITISRAIPPVTDQAHQEQEAEEQEPEPTLQAEPDEEEKIPAAVRNDRERAMSGHVDRKIFGIAVGDALTVPDCPTRPDNWLGQGHRTLDTELIQKACKASTRDSTVQILFPLGALPDWARGPTMGEDGDVSATVEGGVVTAVTIQARFTDQFLRQMKAKYGNDPRTKTAVYTNKFNRTWKAVRFVDWMPAGLHVRFEIPDQSYRDNPTDVGELLVETESTLKTRQAKEAAEQAQKLEP